MKCKLPIVVALLLSVLFAAVAQAAEPCAEDDVACWMKQLERQDVKAMQAAMQLGRLQAEEAIPALIEKLASKDQYMATAALHALISIGQPAVLPLVKATKSEKASVRRYSTYALGRIGNGSAYDAVVAMAKDEEPTVRRQAAEALGVLGDAKSLLPLFELLRDQHVMVRIAAAKSLGQIGDKRAAPQLIEHGLCDLSAEAGVEAAQALVAIGEPAVEFLLNDYSSRPSFARKRILVALGNIAVTAEQTNKKKIVELNLHVLQNSNEQPDVRAVAAYSLGSLEEKTSVDALKQVLKETADAQTDEGKKLSAACRMALDKIYQRYKMTTDY